MPSAGIRQPFPSAPERYAAGVRDEHTTHRSDGWVWARPVSEINATANIVRFLRMFFAAENIGTKNSRLY
jgi:hypothetical protein